MMAWYVVCCADVEFWTVEFINSAVSPIKQYRSGITSTLLLLSAVFSFVELVPVFLIPRSALNWGNHLRYL